MTARSDARTTPPGPRKSLFLGATARFHRAPLHFLDEMSRSYGDLVFLPVGNQKIYLANTPALIRDILVTHQTQFKKSRALEIARVLLGDGLLSSEGEFHHRQRRLVQPAFYRERLAGYGAVMVECAAVWRERWRPSVPIDVAQEMLRLTLGTVARTLFSTNIDSEAEEFTGVVHKMPGLVGIEILPFSELLEKLPLPSTRRFFRGRARLDATIYRLIAEHRDSGRDTGDLLSLLLAARDEADGSRMDDKQVRDEVLTLLGAGYETTAVALTWAWYLLSQNPEAEARFHREIEEVLGDRKPAFEDLPRLRYTESVFAETMRLYPPVWAIGRRALNDYRIGEFIIPARGVFIICPYLVQRDARWFQDPLEFRPERWLAAEAERRARSNFTYFPFGAGARSCVGERFAWTEGILLLATIGQRWHLRLEPGHRAEIDPQLTLRPKYGMRMIPEPRGSR